MKPPEQEDAGPIPADVKAAGMTLIAHMLNINSVVFNMDLKQLRYEGKDLGDFEISVRRVRDPGE
jgi:hypothetical protein